MDTREELLLWHQKLRPGGIMSGHDFAFQWDVPYAVCQVFCKMQHDMGYESCGTSEGAGMHLAADYTFYWFKDRHV